MDPTRRSLTGLNTSASIYFPTGLEDITDVSEQVYKWLDATDNYGFMLDFQTVMFQVLKVCLQRCSFLGLANFTTISQHLRHCGTLPGGTIEETSY